MTFEATAIQETVSKYKKARKATYPFADMKAKPGTGFVIPAEREDLFQHCRVLASNYNKQHGTAIKCNKLSDGSLRVWNESTTEQPADNTEQLLQESIAAVEAKKEDRQAPFKEQFVAYLLTVPVGMSIKLDKEYAHRFTEFQTWAAELASFDTVVTYNPPELKITRKAGNADDKQSS